MVNKNKKRVMITLSQQVIDLLNQLLKETGESYSEYFARVVISESLERK